MDSASPHPRPAQLHLDPRLGLVLRHAEPLQVRQLVASAADQSLAVVYLVARAGPTRRAGGRAGVLAHELGAQGGGAVGGDSMEAHSCQQDSGMHPKDQASSSAYRDAILAGDFDKAAALLLAEVRAKDASQAELDDAVEPQAMGH